MFTRAGGEFGEDTLFTARADGTGEKRIERNVCCPRLSSDGRRFLFGAEAPGERITIGIADFDGTHRRTLPLADADINMGPGAWSPRHELIAVQVWDGARPRRAGAYLVRAADGSGLRRLTKAPAGNNDVPLDFSPDGKTIVFFREPPDSQSIGSLWTVRTDGKNVQRITPPGLKVGISARWSPDGRKILFAAARLERTGEIYTVRPDGTALETVFKDARGRFAITPTWSPDGSRIMFALNPTNDEFQHPPNELAVINADGSGLQRVLGGADFKRNPEWRR